ncbi:MAG: hypothetical protein ABUS56_00965 [Acidobacteriota bacterium]
MTELTCGYPGDREAAIVSYLYDEGESEARAAFDVHLDTCARCRDEVAAFEGLRTQLRQWTPPEPAGLPGGRPFGGADASRGWTAIPVWAQMAAAVLVLGVAAGVARLDIRYDANGLRVRTGWSPDAAATPPASPAPGGDAEWRAALFALERRLDAASANTVSTNTVAASTATVSAASVNAASVNDVPAETLRRVRALVEEGERRQQRELALRLGEVLRDVNAQRQSDLARIDRSIGAMQNSTGLEILRTRETINDINNYIVRTSSQRPQ